MNRLGKLLIIGFGPGAMEHITGRALAALEESEAVIGYSTYVDLVRPLLRHQEIVGTGMTEEVSRAQEAVRRAEAGQTIAVISSGDAGVYGMAGLVYEVLIERGWKPDTGVEVEVIPGISAIQSCSSLLGAPIMHDSCTISLSDHLTPWESIAARVEAAGIADFVIAFYNPRSGKRTRQIEEARQILLRHRDPATPVGIVKSAYRDRQQTIITTLQDMLNHEIGMLSTVIVGNSATIVYEGLLVTPRGYERKYCLGADTQVLKPHERLRTSAEPWSLAAVRAGGDESASRKPAVLLVGHGSRVEEGNEELRNFTRLLAARRPEYTIETCFIELSAPSISEGIDQCVRGGAGKVYVVPIILFAAGHSKLDIPMALDQVKLKYPDVEFIYGRPIGVQERAAEILLDRIAGAVPLSRPIRSSGQWAQSGDITNDARVLAHHSPLEHPDSGKLETAAALPEEEAKVTDEDTIVLVMGRGGSDPDANSDLFKLTRLLWERTSFKSVEACFIAMAKPSLTAGLERCLVLGARKIIVLPYLLFTGVLMRQFSETVNGFAAAHPEIQVEAGSYLGTHPLLSDMLLDRIDETVAGRASANCDNCKYRDEASIHHHHHHHSDEAHHHGSHGGEGHGCRHGHGHGHGCGHGHHHNHDHHAHNHETRVTGAATVVETAVTLSPSEVSRDVLNPLTAPKAR